jgi:glycosyl transferase family 90
MEQRNMSYCLRYFVSIIVIIYASSANAEVKNWVQSRLDSDFSKFHAKGIHKNQFQLIDKLILENKIQSLMHYQIINNKIYVNLHDRKSNRYKVITEKLNSMIAQGYKFPNVEFVIGFDDAWDQLGLLKKYYPEISLADLPPILVFAADKKSKYRDHYILFVDDYTIDNSVMGNRRGWASILQDVAKGNKLYNWQNKIDKVMWRGLDTDCCHYVNCEDSPRSKLVEISNNYPDIIDAKYAKPKYFYSFIKKNLRPLMLMLSIPPFISQEKQIAYRVLANLDGHTTTYPGLLWRLYSNSLVIKQDSTKEQWFYDILVPWKHYVPMKNDASDIVEKATWVMNNKDKAYDIVKEANSIVKHNLMPEHIDDYIKELLNYHFKLQRYNIEKQDFKVYE